VSLGIVQEARRLVDQAKSRVQEIRGQGGIIGQVGQGQGLSGLLGGKGVLALGRRTGLLGEQGLLGGQRLRGGGQKLSLPKIEEIRTRGVLPFLEDNFPRVKQVRQKGVIQALGEKGRGMRGDITDHGITMAVESKPAHPADHRDMSFEL